MKTMAIFVGLTVLMSGVALAQEIVDIDLNGLSPSEKQVMMPDGVSHILMWNSAREQWIDLFRENAGPDGIKVGPVKGADVLADLIVHGRKWAWNGSGYSPQPAGDIPSQVAPPSEVMKLAGSEIGSASSMTAFGYDEPDGSTTYVVAGYGVDVCGSGGAWCPAVVIRDGNGVAGSFGISGEAAWAPSDRLDGNGFRLIETSDGEDLSLIEPSEVEPVEVIERQRAAIADPQLEAPMK